jgi:hypothetical protein
MSHCSSEYTATVIMNDEYLRIKEAACSKVPYSNGICQDTLMKSRNGLFSKVGFNCHLTKVSVFYVAASDIHMFVSVALTERSPRVA